MTALWSSPERLAVLQGEHRYGHRYGHCVTCAGERLFERPVCLDGHEPGECPEWACAECGHAIWLGLAECARPLVTAAV
ncbi:hypothetical protein [Nonomuraea sp. SBT364]|uniref:hypothetical protein n=1 Tax=Nonomuraea sp. SBT364 TaxID=1580530 RepID=UPI001E447751|nr:hypothetical protein [Nonomuraea sp. SBT364]